MRHFCLSYKGPFYRVLSKFCFHDLRHSHVSLLINMGFTVLAIADRMGHESIDITYRYAHLFPSEQVQMAEQLDIERMVKSNGEELGQ
ncbi:tyrosine-type recombinase/integrase [Ruminococcus gauvreauii]|uniref:Tyrosine-type recombinase/integrase n=1 Tax=Ruminococcus gauvreauii TaxID=438033 RepID=A0ABY5VMQ3_9FIRM|nr:tyrosine-type recombinase/integrase [Ruminococcus gauvreauii]UWP61378.1 tyrosine-type recombinase/integrase [Ruminococcus gauvreauii]